ncbi:TRAP transporter small permease [Desulfovibrio sp. OttesenSCG-928-C14]|nr:TRAP transporter small permease [Desulfovibrio sp. OttesenSCG-928-C14]
MPKLLSRLEWCASRLGFALLLIMSFVIGLQVFMRYLLNDSLMWPEEMTRYCYLWCSMLAIVVVEQRGAHLRIDVLREYSGARMKKILDAFSRIVTIVFYAILIWLSIKMTLMVNDMEQYAISFELPMVYVWLAFPLLYCAALLFSFANFTKLFRKPQEK